MRRLALLAALSLGACSTTDQSAARSISPSIVLTNTTQHASPPPPGPFVSVLDSIELRVTPENGERIAPLGQRLGGYRTTATLQPSFPPGNTKFEAEVFSSARVSVFSGSVTQLITSDVLSLPLPLKATRPVLLMVPDTSRTTTVTSTQFAVYNAGVGSLDWSVIGTDTAFTRCGAACTISPSSGSVAPGATTNVRVSIPSNFPSRLFSFLVRSVEGNVTVRWQYSASAVTGVTVQPTASLHHLGQTFSLTPTVQLSGTAATTVSWSSSSSAVASVNSSGAVTGVSRGVATVTAASTVDTSKKASADIRVYDSTAATPTWSAVAPAQPDTVRRDDTSPGSKSTVVLRAQASGTLAAVASAPFTAVEFWVRPGSTGPWRRVGQSSAGVEGTDGSGGRVWSWSYTWNPDATDAPFTNPSTTGMSVLAIGITSSGQTMATAVNQNLSVRVP